MKRCPRLRHFFGWGTVVTLALIACFWIFENRRGAREWQEVQSRAEEVGMFLLRSDYAGAPIPDEENLLRDPAFLKAIEDAREGRLDDWWELFATAAAKEKAKLPPQPHPETGTSVDYREFYDFSLSGKEAISSLIDAARDIDTRLDELADVILAKPVSPVFVHDIAAGELLGDEWAAASEQIEGWQRLVRCFGSSGLVAIRKGDSQRALKTIKLLDRLSQMVCGPGVVSYLVSSSIALTGRGLLWEGLRLEKWSLDQLELIEGILSERKWREEYLSVLKYEAALTLGILDTYLKGSMPPQRYQDGRSHLLSEWLAVGGPQGWDDRRRAFTIEFFVDLIPLVDSAAGLAKYRTQFHQRFEGSTLSPIYYWHYLLEMELHAARASLQIETAKRIALIALALEKARLKTGRYPQDLSELDGDVALVDLSDPQARELGYQLGPNGRVEIWSANEQEREKSDRDPRLRWQYWPVSK
ncbi:hypothetical protein N9B14_03260 [Akkermansiaceae bacterium]|nr:hypothetical protein [Akkermansiaceae bacterium]